jgi:hypothetical protein
MPNGQVPVPFPQSSSPGTHFQESGGRIINSYIEPLGGSAPSDHVYRRAPGLALFGTTTQTGFRGAIEVQGVLYSAWANRLVKHTSVGGVATDIGIVGGTSKGFFARNNKSGEPDKVFVDPDGTQFIFNVAGTITTPIDADLPAPNSVCSIDGFFVFTIGDGRVFASDLNATTINPLSFATAEAKPDGLTRGLPWAGNLFLFGPSTTEVWINAGTTPFPFQRSVVIPRGIAGPYCVAGFEDNFSRTLVWVADDNTVVQLNGYTPEKISPPDLDGLIEKVTDKRQLEMSVYISRGHAFIVLSATAGTGWDEWTWIFDLNNNRWAERQSYLRRRSRITGGVYAFNKWLCGDITSGNILEITNRTHVEVNKDISKPPDPFRWRLESGAVENFPVGARIGRADFAFVTGVGITTESRAQPIVSVVSSTGAVGGKIRIIVNSALISHDGDAVQVFGVLGTTEANGTWPVDVIGATTLDLVGSSFQNAYTSGGTLTELSALDPIETDPVVEISWSDDGGQTYYAPLIRKLGKQAQTKQLVSLIAVTGRSSWNARRWRLDIADPVDVGFMGAYQQMSPKVSDI